MLFPSKKLNVQNFGLGLLNDKQWMTAELNGLLWIIGKLTNSRFETFVQIQDSGKSLRID
jgi:hypothetical protein